MSSLRLQTSTVHSICDRVRYLQSAVEHPAARSCLLLTSPGQGMACTLMLSCRRCVPFCIWPAAVLCMSSRCGGSLELQRFVAVSWHELLLRLPLGVCQALLLRCQCRLNVVAATVSNTGITIASSGGAVTVASLDIESGCQNACEPHSNGWPRTSMRGTARTTSSLRARALASVRRLAEVCQWRGSMQARRF